MEPKNIKLALHKVKIEEGQETLYFRQHFYRYFKTLCYIPQEFVLNKVAADLGTVPGHLSRTLKFLGAANVTGLDYNPERFGFKQRIERQGVKVLTCDLEKEPLPFPDHSLDLITFTEVIEHFEKGTGHVLSEIKRCLKPGGALVITTPNINNLANRLRRLFGKNIYPSSVETGPLSKQQHHHEYFMKELKELLENEGFNVIKSKYIAGTEKALLENNFPIDFPRWLGKLYALVPFLLPPLRSYLFILAQPK